MKKRFKIENLDCAHCAAKVEEAIKKLGGVNSASVNFMAQKLVLDANDEHFEEIMQAVRETAKKIEPDCVIK